MKYASQAEKGTENIAKNKTSLTMSLLNKVQAYVLHCNKKDAFK
jgi:hypothetical protein